MPLTLHVKEGGVTPPTSGGTERRHAEAGFCSGTNTNRVRSEYLISSGFVAVRRATPQFR